MRADRLLFYAYIADSIRSNPLRDGRRHRMDDMLAETIRATPNQCPPALSEGMEQCSSIRPWLFSMTLYLLGRLDHGDVRPWGIPLMRDALQHERSEVRARAIEAIGSWDVADGFDLLRGHTDDDEELREYTQRIIDSAKIA